MVKETQAKQFKPGLRVRFGTMDYIERGCEFPVHMNRDVVAHSGTMEYGPVPVLAWHLLLCEVDAGHLDKSMPGALNETVDNMYFGRGYDDLGLGVIYPSEEISPYEFEIEVGM